MPTPTYDEEIMNKLLSEPEVRNSVLSMSAAELKFFKELLVLQGIYARYVEEHKS